MSQYWMILIVVYLVIFLQACAPTIYDYEHIWADGSKCTIHVESTRNFSDGTVVADENCALTGGLSGVKTNQAVSEIAGTIAGAAINTVLGRP
jgi:hypothetical protein